MTRPKDGFFFRAESFFNVASRIEIIDSDPDNVDNNSGPAVVGSFGGRSLHGQSHGESFIALVTKRFAGSGLYLLDEPEAALSPSRQMGVLSVIHDLVKRHSQFIIVTHSPIIMAYPNSAILSLLRGQDRRYQIHRNRALQSNARLPNHRESMLRVLMGEDAAHVS